MRPADQKLEGERRERLARVREQRRFELAKAAMNGLVAAGRSHDNRLNPDGMLWREIATEAVGQADAVLAAMDDDKGSETA